MKLSTFITEQQNAHMEHLEDMIFNDGVSGARAAISSLQNLRDMLAGHSKNKVNVTVKWDGAPAIFAGVDPTDGKFFVAKKGVFNKNPKVYKTAAEVDKDASGDLAAKLKVALIEFNKLGIKSGVYQGDLMFTDDKRIETIAGEKYIVFHPNTIVYAVPSGTPLAVQIQKAKIGVVWHTTYTGSSFETMTASFGKSIIDHMTKVPSVWMDDATYRDISGNATFTAKETKEVNIYLSDADKALMRISASSKDVLRLIQNDEELKQKIKTFNNTFVRAGEPFPNPKSHVKELYQYIMDWYQKEIDSKKTDKSKQEWTNKRNRVAQLVFTNVSDLENVFKLMNYIVQAKQMIINKMNYASTLGTFLLTSNGFKATSHEGYVAIDHLGQAVKLVDRLEFSRANFSSDVLKGWQK